MELPGTVQSGKFDGSKTWSCPFIRSLPLILIKHRKSINQNSPSVLSVSLLHSGLVKLVKPAVFSQLSLGLMGPATGTSAAPPVADAFRVSRSCTTVSGVRSS